MKKINLILLSFLVLFQIEAFAYWDKDHWSERPNAPIVAILDDDIPGRDSSLLNMLSSQFKAKGMEVKHVNVATISDRDKFNVFNYDVLVLPNGSLNIIGRKKRGERKS